MICIDKSNLCNLRLGRKIKYDKKHGSLCAVAVIFYLGIQYSQMETVNNRKCKQNMSKST